MTDLLCRGLDPEMWWTGDSRNRLAVLICGQCEGCPDDDPTPAGVIRRGVAYSDSGKPLPQCACGTPCAGYLGGTVKCKSCIEPTVPIPHVNRERASWMVRLHERGLPDEQIAVEAGITAHRVKEARREYRVRVAA